MKVSTDPIYSFSCRVDKTPDINNYWHRHAELELIKIEQGSGTLYIGNKILRFTNGDLVLIGSNIPHYWKFDDKYFTQNNQLDIDIIAVHFSDKFWGDSFINLPENRAIKEVIEKSQRGILLRNCDMPETGKLLYKIYNAVDTERILLFLRVLMLFAKEEMFLLMPVDYNSSVCNKFINERVTVIYNYLLKNFKNNIQLNDVANVAQMTPNAFCRYFKSTTGKTYSQLLIEIKIEYACKLLIGNNINIKCVCYESGFNNLASFYKNFKQIVGTSPLNYQKQFSVANNKHMLYN